MTIINILQFSGYDQPAFLEFLRLHGTSFIEVIIPKEYDHTDPHMIVCDYYRALYVSQMLLQVSTEVMYTIPDPDTKGEFSFILICEKPEELSHILSAILAGYDYEANEDAYMDFDLKACDLPSYIKEDTEIACPQYLDVINEYDRLL